MWQGCAHRAVKWARAHYGIYATPYMRQNELGCACVRWRAQEDETCDCVCAKVAVGEGSRVTILSRRGWGGVGSAGLTSFMIESSVNCFVLAAAIYKVGRMAPSTTTK